MRSIYEEVTASIIEELEKGVKPWVQSWKGNVRIPVNAATGRHYSGTNIILLWMNTHMKGWPNMKYLTYMQANQLGGRIRKGEKSVSIVFTSFKEVGEEKKLVPFVKRHAVFNLAQTEGIELPEPEPLPESERLSRVNRIVAASGIEVQHGDYSPCYRPGQDTVLMPHFSAFNSENDYVSTLGHELVHSTSHPTRLNRKFSSKIFKENYGQEECVAELGSAYFCAHIGYDYSAAQSPAYIDYWLKILKSDSRAIFSLASYASHACDWLIKPAKADDGAGHAPSHHTEPISA